MHWFYDPLDGDPWSGGKTPEFVYTVAGDKTNRPFVRTASESTALEDEELRPSGEAAIPIVEALGCGLTRELPAINVPNQGAIPGLPDDLIVEVPAVADGDGWRSTPMAALPEPVNALIRVQDSIQSLLVEAFAEESKDKLIQAILLEPTVNSYRRAVEMVDEMLRLQADLLPRLY